MVFLQMAGTLEQEVMVRLRFLIHLMEMVVLEALVVALRFGVLQIILGQVLVGLMVAQAKVAE